MTISSLTRRVAGDVIVDGPIAIKESVAVAKDVGAARQIDQEEECRGKSQSRKLYGID
jgi:hypothetical protein